MKFNRYALTKTGEAICIESYCLRLCNNKSTNVILFQDMDKLNKVKEDNIDWSKPFNELKL